MQSTFPWSTDFRMKLLDYDSERINFIYTDDNSKDLIGRISINCDTDPERVTSVIDLLEFTAIV